MPRTRRKKMVFFICCFFAAGIVGFFAVRQTLVMIARHEVDKIIAEAKKESPATDDDLVVAITRSAYRHFDRTRDTYSFLLAVRPYVTNYRLPRFIRLPKGTIESLVKTGYCDNAARMLDLTMERAGFHSVQWNMVTPQNGHAALRVSLPGERYVLADAYYGYVTKDKTGLISPERAKEKMRAGAPLEKVFLALDKTSDPFFYKDFAQSVMGRSNTTRVLEADLPPIKKGNPVFIGEINGDKEDVKSAAREYEMNPYWHYMGHIYNRGRIRVLHARQKVKVVMTLVANADPTVVVTEPLPVIDGKKLTWNLDKGDSITIRDGLAKLSLWRLNSYIGVDQIAIYPR